MKDIVKFNKSVTLWQWSIVDYEGPKLNHESYAAAVLGGGGIDSFKAFLCALERHRGERIAVIHIDYGQRSAKRELEAILRWVELSEQRADLFTMSIDIGIRHALLEPKIIYYDTDRLTASLDASGDSTEASETQFFIPHRNIALLFTAMMTQDNLHFDYIYTGFERHSRNPAQDEKADVMFFCQSLLQTAHHDTCILVTTDDFSVREYVHGLRSGVSCTEDADVLNALHLESLNKSGSQHRNAVTERILRRIHHSASLYNYTWSCWNNGLKPCGVCGKCLDIIATLGPELYEPDAYLSAEELKNHYGLILTPVDKQAEGVYNHTILSRGDKSQWTRKN